MTTPKEQVQEGLLLALLTLRFDHSTIDRAVAWYMQTKPAWEPEDYAKLSEHIACVTRVARRLAGPHEGTRKYSVWVGLSVEITGDAPVEQVISAWRKFCGDEILTGKELAESCGIPASVGIQIREVGEPLPAEQCAPWREG